MDDTPTTSDLQHYGVKSAQEREKDIQIETRLWDEVLEDTENPERHKKYFGHALRSGLLKEGSRRYGPLLEDKVKYSIETRRLARFYQKQIMNILFMKPMPDMPKKKNPTLGYIFAFFSVMTILTGAFEPKLWYLIPAGLFFLVPYIYIKFKQAKEKSNRTRAESISSGL